MFRDLPARAHLGICASVWADSGDPSGWGVTPGSDHQAEARRWTQTAWPLFHVFTAVLAVGHGTRPRVCEKRHRLAFSPGDDKKCSLRNDR